MKQQEAIGIHWRKETKELVGKVCHNPENPKLWIELGDLYASKGKNGFARIYYNEAVKVLENKITAVA